MFGSTKAHRAHTQVKQTVRKLTQMLMIPMESILTNISNIQKTMSQVLSVPIKITSLPIRLRLIVARQKRHKLAATVIRIAYGSLINASKDLNGFKS